MAPLKSVVSNMTRIVMGYFVASLVAALILFLLGTLTSIGDPPMEGRTLLGNLANQAGYIPLFAVLAAILSAPFALLAIAVSEFANIDSLWYFLLVGACAAIPALFVGDGRSIAEMFEGFALLGPTGALASTAYWLIRHRKWPV